MPKKGQSIDLSEKDWEQIKTEYITSDISYRKLADKYGIGYARLQKRGFDEKWQEDRDAYKEKLLKKSVDLICDERAEQIARVMRLGNTILNKVEESLEYINLQMVKTTTTHKTKKTDANKNVIEESKTVESFGMIDVGIDRAGLKQLSSVLKDLKEIGIFRSELDRSEQEARIDKLRKDVKDDEKDTVIKVVIDDALEQFSK